MRVPIKRHEPPFDWREREALGVDYIVQCIKYVLADRAGQPDDEDRRLLEALEVLTK
jgi:hypothetical protein